MAQEMEARLRQQVKGELRKRLSAVRKTMPLEARAARSRAALVTFKTWLENGPELFNKVNTIGSYAPIKGELDPGPIGKLLAEHLGASLALPRIYEPDWDPSDFDAPPPEQSMRFHKIIEGAQLERGAFGVPEPSASAPLVTPEVLLVPALAVDPRGQRIGYGAGFYDRYNTSALRIALVYDFQLAAEIPDEPHDVAVDLLVTDKRVIECSR